MVVTYRSVFGKQEYYIVFWLTYLSKINHKFGSMVTAGYLTNLRRGALRQPKVDFPSLSARNCSAISLATRVWASAVLAPVQKLLIKCLLTANDTRLDGN